MYSPYEPDFGVTIPTHLLTNRAETTFEANPFRGLLGGGTKTSIRGGLKFGRTRQSIKLALESVFKRGKGVEGLSGAAARAAKTNPKGAVKIFTEKLFSYIRKVEGDNLRVSISKLMKKLPDKKPTKSMTIEGTEFTVEELGVFYTNGGNLKAFAKKGAPLADDVTMEGNKYWPKGSKGTDGANELINGLKNSNSDNFLKTSFDALGKADGPLTEANLLIKGDEILRGADFKNSLKKMAKNVDVPDVSKRAVKPKKNAAGEITESSLGITTRKFAVGIGAVFVAGYIVNNFVSLWSESMMNWLDPNCREDVEELYPDWSEEEKNEWVENCKDEAAERMVYFGMAAMGIGGLLLAFIISRIFKMKKTVKE